MKIYTIQTIEFDENGITKIRCLKDFWMSREDAFEQANKIEGTCIVIELTCTKTWNHQQRNESR